MSILDRGSDWLVADKPAGQLVHPTRPGGPPTMWDELRGYYAFELVNGWRLSIINRLDRETSGCVLVATTAAAARRLGLAMRRRQLGKEYLALVGGWPEWEQASCDQPLLRRAAVDPAAATWVEQIVHPDGASASTRVAVVWRGRWRARRIALLRCHPQSGRMHQIRVHLAHLGHPVVGDKLYFDGVQPYLEFVAAGWSPRLDQRIWLRRQALHSHAISFPEASGARRRVESPLPAELAQLAPPLPEFSGSISVNSSK